jgi:hypothetical protein
MRSTKRKVCSPDGAAWHSYAYPTSYGTWSTVNSGVIEGPVLAGVCISTERMTGSVLVGVVVVVVGSVVVVVAVVVDVLAVALVVEIVSEAPVLLDVTRSVVVGLVAADAAPGKAGPEGLPPAALREPEGTYPIIMPMMTDTTIATTIDQVGHFRFSRIGSALEAPSSFSWRSVTGNVVAHRSAGSKKPSTLKSTSSPAAHMGTITSQREAPANNLAARP